MTLSPLYIGDFREHGGLETDIKPFLLNEKAFQTLENAYLFRGRIKKRIGNAKLGQLRRVLISSAMGNIVAGGAGTFTFNIFTGLGLLATEPHATIQPGNITNITIAIAAPISQTLTDTLGTGVLAIAGAGPIDIASINYATGVLTLHFTGAAGASAATFSGAYFPMLPSMGIFQRELATFNIEQTVFFDTKYAYINNSGQFQELQSGFTWAGTDSDLFYAANYRGISPADRFFFVTNFVCDANNPMRYFDGANWNTFQPIVSDAPISAAQTVIFSAKVLIPYYGRLIALNVWEGLTAAGPASATNFYNRCRFSQIGSPVNADSWRSDEFGKGGFVDAPTNEAIVGAYFFKNTLLVDFERSTWQLRYVGEYGFPFQWERISSTYGSESTFSGVIFDDFVLSVGDKAIKFSTAVKTDRIDRLIPDLVFQFRNNSNGVERVYGVRDYQKELVYWAYVDANDVNQSDAEPLKNQVFPNKILVYNYLNQSFSIFDDRITCFGTWQDTNTGDVTWDSLIITWDDMDVTWDDPDSQADFPIIVGGNSQGYIMKIGYQTRDDFSLSITGVDMTVTPVTITVPNHNIQGNQESPDIVFIDGLMYSSPPPLDLNGALYKVQFEDINTLSLQTWNGSKYVDVIGPGASDYIGGGEMQVFPTLDIISKDFNPYGEAGMLIFISYIDLLVDASPSAVIAVNGYTNAGQSVQGNLEVGNKQLETYLQSPFYQEGTEYAWHRWFATMFGQFIRIQITYDDALMNNISTHEQDFVLNGFRIWQRPGGKNIF